MVSFIVVEDDKKMQEKIRDIIIKTTFETDVKFDIKMFDHYDSNLKNIIDNLSEIKIYILDIQLSTGISGLQIAKKIRDNDWENEIVFITNHDRMFEEVYRTVYNVFAFIEKFHNFEPRLKRTIKKLLNKKYDNKIFKYHGRNIDLEVYYHNILYVYRDTDERKLVIKTTTNTYIISMSLQDILKELGPRFKQVHRSCIANTDYIESYNWKEGYFKLTTGEKVPYLNKSYRTRDDKKC